MDLKINSNSLNFYFHFVLTKIFLYALSYNTSLITFTNIQSKLLNKSVYQYLKDLFEGVFSHFNNITPEQRNDPTWLKQNKLSQIDYFFINTHFLC